MTTWRAYVGLVLGWAMLATATTDLVGIDGQPWWLVLLGSVAGAAIFYWCRELHRRSGAPR